MAAAGIPGGMSTVSYPTSSQSKTPLIVGFIVFVIVVVVAFMMFNGSTKKKGEDVDAEEDEDDSSPSASPSTASAESCKSFVDAKVCPSSSATPATSTSCSSFIAAEAAKYQPEAYYDDSYCRNKYKNLTTISPGCTKHIKYVAAVKSGIITVFAATGKSYIKRVTTTGSSVTSEYFMKNQVVNTLADAVAMTVVANKYALPETGVQLYSTTALRTSTPVQYPAFNTDILSIGTDLVAKTQAADVTYRYMTNETSMYLVNAMRAGTDVWTKTYTSADGKVEYYKLNATALANAFEKGYKETTTSEYRNWCGQA
jgi:hypothetical protein